MRAESSSLGKRISSSVIALVLGCSAAAAAPNPPAKRTNPCSCKDLPRMEQELFEQEWLQEEFYKYLIGEKSLGTVEPGKTGAKALSEAVIAALGNQSSSPAGGGGAAGGAAPALEVDFRNCSLFVHKVVQVVRDKKGRVKQVKTKKVPFTPAEEKEFRKQMCDELADSFLEHEKNHIKQCTEKGDSTRFNVESAVDSGRWEVESYGKGIKSLRAAIAKIATEQCGWGGSTNIDGSKNKTKQNHPSDREKVDVVPTLKEARELAKVLAGGKRP